MIIFYTAPEIWHVTNVIIFFILSYFLSFYTSESPKNLKKLKKTPGDIILHMCTINENNMIYGFWDMECDRQGFFSFWTIFYSFTLLTTRKIKFLKKWKPHLEMSSFYACAP